MFKYGTDKLTVQKAMAIARGELPATLSLEAIYQVRKSRQHVIKMAQSPKAVYGINTGFGPLCDTQISPEDTYRLQENLLLTHAVGMVSQISGIF